MERLDNARLYLLFTPELCTGDPWETLAAALRGGVDLVQWRPTEPRRGRRAELHKLLAACAAQEVPVIVNDDPHLAVECGAAGAHVGQGDLPAVAARAILGPHRLLGVSTRDARQLRAAARNGADHVGFGPCYATSTKGYAEGLVATGRVAAVDLAEAGDLPVFAIGGITPDRVPELTALGLRRVAVSSAILRAPAPEAAARAFREQLSGP
ncbi:MAG: thiamine phosphate synthase [Planctomycetota bacterium]